MAKVHICLLSDQLLPNLIPILMDKPHCVYLIVTEEMKARDRHKRMQRLLRRENIESLVRYNAPSTGIDSIRKFAGKLAEEVKKDGENNTIVLNATGGTKLLSMGFMEVFRENLEGYLLQVIYTDTQHQLIETLVPRGLEAKPMGNVLEIESYLAAQGMKLDSALSDDDHWQLDVQRRSNLTEYLASHCVELGGFFGALNGLIHGSNNQHGALSANGNALLHPRQKLNTAPRGNWRKTLNRIQAEGLIFWDGDKEVTFSTIEAARYLSGQWLEEYAWLHATASELQDVSCSAIGQWELQTGTAAPTNEFDLLAVHGNRLLIVECKTGQKSLKEQEVTTRLESLNRNAGGLFGSCLLLSARAITATMRKRCQSLGIHYLEQDGIRKFSMCISEWRDTGTLPRIGGIRV